MKQYRYYKTARIWGWILFGLGIALIIAGFAIVLAFRNRELADVKGEYILATVLVIIGALIALSLLSKLWAITSFRVKLGEDRIEVKIYRNVYMINGPFTLEGDVVTFNEHSYDLREVTDVMQLLKTERWSSNHDQSQKD